MAPSRENKNQRLGHPSLQVFIVGGCLAFRDGLGNWYNWGCSGGDWISIQQLADAWRNLPNAILQARLNTGKSANDIKIQNLANQINYLFNNPMTGCEFGGFVAFSGATLGFPFGGVLAGTVPGRLIATGSYGFAAAKAIGVVCK